MSSPPLGATHGRHILHGFLAIHRRLEELEALMSQPACSSPFCQHANDLAPQDAEALHRQFEHIRAVMLEHLNDHGIPIEVRRTSVRWALQTSLMQLQLEIEELGPERLRRYGPLGPAGQTEALRIQSNLRELLDRSPAFLADGVHPGSDEPRDAGQGPSLDLLGHRRP
jgi:hypothetical protein